MLKKNTPENAQQYKKYRNKLTHIKEQAKKSYYEKLVGKIAITQAYYGKQLTTMSNLSVNRHLHPHKSLRQTE